MKKKDKNRDRDKDKDKDRNRNRKAIYYRYSRDMDQDQIYSQSRTQRRIQGVGPQNKKKGEKREKLKKYLHMLLSLNIFYLLNATYFHKSTSFPIIVIFII